jgi:pimeloyl-ACP methyl ester carboxylesterase
MANEPGHPKKSVVAVSATRRAVLTAAAATVGVASLSSASRTAANVRTADADAAAIWSGDYWTNKGAVRLYMYRKRIGAPRTGAARRPAVFLVHGSSLSSRSTFDFKTENLDFSMMDMLARAGFDVWTMDHEGYGRSSRTDSNSDLASGAEDLRAGMEVIHRENGSAAAHFFGESSGALRAGIFANQHPEAVDRLVLSAFSYTGIGSPTLTERAKQLEFFRTHQRRPRDHAMIASIFARDGLTAPPELIDKLAAEELQFGDSVPTGSYLDMSSKLPVVDPLLVKSPLLIVRGEHDGIATLDDVLDFFRKVPGSEKQVAIVPGAHSLTQGPGYRQMWHLVRSFLTMTTQTGWT